jgi:transcriptional regulator with GAF, ATPase, and Fis domain
MSENNPDSERLTRALNELRIINNLLSNISQIRETNHIMDTIISQLIAVTDADQGVINLVSPAEIDNLQTVVRKSDSGLPYKLNDLISGWVLKNRTVLKIDDLDNDDRFTTLSSENGQYKSLICFPMVSRKDIIGITTLVRNEQKEPFSEDQTRLAGILASQSAQILSNALLLDELARKNELLEISQKKLKDENIRLQGELKTTYGFENIIGKSAEMRKVLGLVSKFCENDSPVLITGETGTGKELVARAIHYNSRRKEKPFVIKNCGVKTEQLLESELFGHTRGSFTGAVKDKIGLFKEADGGTIFLDEIGDASLSTQAAILRVIQHGEIRPIGSSKTGIVNVRVLSATNKNLKNEIEQGDFREDLFYRLSTFLIELPPLRERPDDIPLLTNHFIKKQRIKTGNEKLAISKDALDALMSYPWPGNIRQLENELERAAVICSPGDTIDVSHLSSEMVSSASEGGQIFKFKGRLRDNIEKVEKDIVKSSLLENDWNILQTSQQLGLTRKGLKDKMARYGIKKPVE